MHWVLPLVLVSIVAAQEPDAEARPSLTHAQMAADLRQLAQDTGRTWSYAEARKEDFGLDLSQLAEGLVSRLDGVRNDTDFFLLLQEFVAGLQDGHAWVAWDRPRLFPFRRWPFTVIDTEEGLVVDRVLKTYLGTPVNLVRGDILLEVEGRPVEDLLREAMVRSFASTPGARRATALAAITMHWTDPTRYKVKHEDGTTSTVVAPSAALPYPSMIKEGPVLETSQVEPDIGYMRIRTFAHHDHEAWGKAEPKDRPALLADSVAAIRGAFANVKGSRALILDLRGNGGGTDLLGKEVASHLLPANSVYYGLQSRRPLIGFTKPSQHRLPATKPPDAFTGRLVVLIDEGCFSVTDNLCRCLDDLHPDITFIGRPTAGGTGAPRPEVKLKHSGASVTFCTMRVFGPNGERIEGRGTVPDIVVRTRRSDVMEQRDPILEAAAKFLRE